MQYRDALKRVRNLFHSPAEAAPDELGFAGPTLLQQEPDLAGENRRYLQDSSGWAASGHPTE